MAMKGLVVVAALAALGLSGCQTGISYADAQASCETQGYRVGTKRFQSCMDNVYRYTSSTTAVTFGVVDEPVYVAPGPVVFEGYYGAPAYYGRRYYGSPNYGNSYYGRPYYGRPYWR
jgi:hypothetical protein